jgi:hypothetical protein
VTTVPDIPVVQLPALDGVDPPLAAKAASAADLWAVDLSRGRGRSPFMLAVVAALAGVAAMALGAAAVIAAGASSDPASVPVVTTPTSAAIAPVERQALGLLAKPSTERVAFTGMPGLVLAVGSAGRAAILVRGVPRAPAGKPYVAWIVAPGREPVRAAAFTGAERALFLSRPLGPRATVVVSATRPASGPLARNRVVALRG